MPDRTITFGGDASEARYRLRDTDPATSGDFVIERLDGSGNVVDTIQSWDDVAEEWSVPNVVATVLDAQTITASSRLDGPTYPTRGDAPDEDGFYAIQDVDGEGNFGVIYRDVN